MEAAFLLFSVVFFLPSSFSGFRRPFRGCSAFFGCRAFAAARAFSLFPPSGGGLDRRLGVIIAQKSHPYSSIKLASSSILFANMEIFS